MEGAVDDRRPWIVFKVIDPQRFTRSGCKEPMSLGRALDVVGNAPGIFVSDEWSASQASAARVAADDSDGFDRSAAKAGVRVELVAGRKQEKQAYGQNKESRQEIPHG